MGLEKIKITSILRIIVFVASLILIGYVISAMLSSSLPIDKNLINPDFETGDLKGWTKTGNAFDNQPTLGDNSKARNRETSNHQGKWWIGGYEKYQGKSAQKSGDIQGDKPIGTLTSEPFIIQGNLITFLIGAGNYPWVEPDGNGSTCVNLIIDGKVVRTATGHNLETMKEYTWDVSNLNGKTAIIQLVDKNTGGWGHINFDDFKQINKWQVQKWDFILYLWTGGILLLISIPFKPLQYVWRPILALSGIILLIISAPHEQPWSMKHVQSALSDRTLINVSYSFLKASFSASAFGKSILGVLGGLILVNPSLTRWLKTWLKKPYRLIILIAVIGYLIFTLKPTPGGWGIVSYLILGFSGVIMLFIGAYHILGFLSRKLAGFGNSIKYWFDKIPAWILVTSLFTIAFIVTNINSYFIFEHIPHIQDSLDQVFHGKIFLLGKFAVSSPEPREFFDFTHMINNGKWYSEYPPGHSLLMGLGHIIHAPWIINPLFGSLCIVLFYFIGKEMFNNRIGRLSALLGTFSPFLIFMSSEFMNHATTLFFVSLFLLGFVRMVHRRKIRYGILCGFALGFTFNIRPMTAAAIAVPFFIYAIAILIRLLVMDKGSAIPFVLRKSFHFIIICVVAMMIFSAMVGVLLYFNYNTNGDPFTFGYTIAWGKNHDPGFGHSGWGEPHTPQRGYIQTLNNLNALNKYLFEIPIPALIFALLSIVSPGVKIWDLLLLGSASSLSFAYFFYWFQDWCFGPRFMFESTIAFIILTARGIIALPDIAREMFQAKNMQKVSGIIAIFLILCFCIGFSSNLPALIKTYSSNYWSVNGKVQKAVKNLCIENAVIF
ncbi:MAG: hypothetical protein QG641_2109, partial [Candidatus Poribacteria bacterium]|nr:hypothetical protein [Candidatus Poribacteria bacterium]